ncbi:hypothetical protein LOK49_LG07G00104 [Camellia lanceoleosa]|uniref:Uncharacterized protein n=1 Tax=Camellia lanceoleosa TaxID=1840588 RepID=A0ACC0H493_9ERIC|nr:hypothetical protein LOK49_LG07G00104 [Camellia lanceoleosa]
MASGSCVGRNRKRSASASWSRPAGDTSTRKAPKRQSRLPYKKQRVSVNVGKNADAADSSKAMYRSNISGVIKTVLELDFGEGHIREIRKTPFAAMVDAIRAHNLIPQSFKKCDATVCRIIKTYNPEDEKFHIGGAKLPLRNNDIRLIFGLQCGKDKLDLSVGQKGPSDFMQRRCPNVGRMSSKVIKDLLMEAIRGRSVHCDKLVGTIRECHIIKPEPVLIDHSEAGQNVMNVDPVNEGRNVDPSFNCWQKDSADGGDVRKDKNGTPTSKKKVIDAYGAMLTDMHRTVSGRREYQGTAYVSDGVSCDK